MLHGYTLTSVLALLAACGSSSTDHELLSTSRLALRELATGTVEVDSADFTVSAAVPVLTITKGGAGFSVTPTCAASHGADATYEVVVTAGTRTETLEVVVTNEPGVACFQAGIVATAQLPTQIACADIVGDGRFEVVDTDGGSPAEFAQVLPGLGSGSDVAAAPISSSIPQPMQQLFAIAGQPPQIYAVDTGENIYQLQVGSTGATWMATGKRVGTPVIAMRSAASETPDFFAGYAPCNQMSGNCVHFAEIRGNGVSEAALGLGSAAYLGSWEQGSGLSVISFTSPSLQNGEVCVLKPEWSSLPPITMTANGCAVPATGSSSSPTTVVLASRSGPSDEHILLLTATGSYEGVVSEISDAPPLTTTAYGGVRSLASTPDGGVLVGADLGAELSRVKSPGQASYELIDLAVQKADNTYAEAIAPCLDKTGAFVGYAVVAGYVDSGFEQIRVALLPDLP